MGNTYFQFKQFTIQQSKATLKVCTESCLFGAYIPTTNAQTILDIGTGTGILALMLAQRSSAHIKAIELDRPSFEDAQDNFLASPWNNRLDIECINIKDYTQQTEDRFDLIVCNPPFFIQQLKSPHHRINTALHGNELQPSDLYKIVNTLIKEEGKFYVLLPEIEMTPLVNQFKGMGWLLIDFLSVYQKENKTVFRTIAGFSKTSSPVTPRISRLIIHEEEGNYTQDFQNLLKDYYLHL